MPLKPRTLVYCVLSPLSALANIVCAQAGNAYAFARYPFAVPTHHLTMASHVLCGIAQGVVIVPTVPEGH